ncbi:MAG: SdrD B-like domain-containing protein, partial [Chthoniobacterales bacterium]
PGHRQNIHGNFREIGVGVIDGTNGSVGPQIVTEDFGFRYDTPAMITGVVYRDLNGNGFYDPGEGIGGVTVTVAGANYYAVTAASGGYSVPVPADGNYAVTFTDGGVAASQQTAAIANSNNAKVDYVVAAAAQVTPPSQPTPTPSANVALANISTRSFVGTGADVMIGGFIVTGTQPKKVIVRATGPSLPLADKLLDPLLELHNSAGAVIATNVNWIAAANSQEIVASTIAPSDPHESAILTTLNPGSYTAVVSGADHGTGSAVIEIYDLDRTVDSQLANISTRGLVQTGDHAMIGGVILMGQTQMKVLVRALGPSLGISSALANPTLELRDANGGLLMSNDDWRSTQAAEIIATTIPPSNDKEAAVIATLQPAAYTAIVRGANNTTGVAIIEAYGLK